MQAAHEKGHPNLYHAKDVRIINILQFSNYKYELKARKDDKINILSQKIPKKQKWNTFSEWDIPFMHFVL